MQPAGPLLKSNVTNETSLSEASQREQRQGRGNDRTTLSVSFTVKCIVGWNRYMG